MVYDASLPMEQKILVFRDELKEEGKHDFFFCFLNYEELLNK
jgi:hypothetical protein